MRRHAHTTTIVGSMISAACLLVCAAEPVFTLRAERQPAACHVRIRVTIEPHADNRSAWVRAVSEDGASEKVSAWSMDGRDATRTRWVEWRAVPRGLYAVEGAVVGSDGHARGRDETRTIVACRY